MSLSAREQQALESIEDGLAESDPGLASRLGIFSRLASGRGAAVASHLRRADRSRAGAKQPRSCRMRAIVGNSMYRAGARPRCAAGRQVERQRAV